MEGSSKERTEKHLQVTGDFGGLTSERNERGRIRSKDCRTGKPGASEDRIGGSRVAANEKIKHHGFFPPEGRDRWYSKRIPPLAAQPIEKMATSTFLFPWRTSETITLNHTKIPFKSLWKSPDGAQRFICNILQHWLTQSQRVHSHFFFVFSFTFLYSCHFFF